jgi:hypothetical protein
MTPELIKTNKKLILSVFPEAAGAFEAASGCRSCGSARALGALFSIIARLPKKGRAVDKLAGIIPALVLRDNP